jgi:hypothetical protein
MGKKNHRVTFFARFLTFALRFFAALTIAALPAGNRTRFLTPLNGGLSESFCRRKSKKCNGEVRDRRKATSMVENVPSGLYLVGDVALLEPVEPSVTELSADELQQVDGGTDAASPNPYGRVKVLDLPLGVGAQATAGVAELLVGCAVYPFWDESQPGRRAKTLANQRIMVIEYTGQKPALILAVPSGTCRTEAHMDNIKKSEEQVNAAEPQLNPTELDKVAGGSASTGGGGEAMVSEISITKKVDSASPKLYE